MRLWLILQRLFFVCKNKLQGDIEMDDRAPICMQAIAPQRDAAMPLKVLQDVPLEQSPAVRITLQRPEVRNAFDGTLVEALIAAFEGLSAANRVVVLAGAGSVFCAGADLRWMRASAKQSEAENAAGAKRMGHLFSVIHKAPQAVLARVQGAAVGGGLGLVAACDGVVLASDARLGCPEVRLGLVPAVIAPFVVAKMGVAAARRYFLTGELFDAQRALGMGLAHEAVAEAELDAEIARWLGRLLKAGPKALAHAKALIHRVVADPYSKETQDDTANHIAALRASDEGQEGLQAFLDKRSPSWVTSRQ